MKFSLNLRKRLMLLMAATLLPLFALSIAKAFFNANAAVEQAMINLSSAASLAASSQQRVSQTVQQVLTAIIKTPGIHDGPSVSCGRYLAELKRALPDYANLGIMGRDGYSRCHSLGREDEPRHFLGDRRYFREALARRSFAVGDYAIGRLSGKPTVGFGLPALDERGEVSFVAYAGLDLASLAGDVAAIKLPPGAELGIHDRDGNLLAGSTGLIIKPGQKMSSPLLRDALNNLSTGVRQGDDGRGQQRLYAFMPSSAQADTAFFVVVSIDRDQVTAPLHRQLWLELAVLTLLALLGGWLAWVMAGRAIVRPAAAILEATRQIQAGHLETRIAVHQGPAVADEFAQITAGFNRMAESLAQQQRTLAAELARSQATQGQLQDAQRLARMGCWETDLASGRVGWSDEIYTLLELERSMFDGTVEGFVQRIHPLDRDRFKQARDAALRTGAVLDIEFRVVTPSGKVLWIKAFGKIHKSGQTGKSRSLRGVAQDITERKNAELCIASNTELLNHTGCLAKIGGWELDAQTLALQWSAQMHAIHEVEPAQAPLTLEAALAFHPDKARAGLKAAIEAALAQGGDWDMELPLTTASGRQLWVRTQGRALLKDGKVARLMGVLQDISAQHAAQAHLRLLEACIAQLNDMVVITEAEPLGEPGPRIVFVNGAFERHTGYSLPEVLGRSPRFLQGPATDRAALARIGAALRAWQPVCVELINYTKSGQPFWVELDIVPIANEEGWFTHWVAVQRDITQRKLAEQALRDSEQRYAALFETAPVSMWVYDLQTGGFLAVNQAACLAYGYSAQEFLAMTIFDLRPASEHEVLRQWLANPQRKTALWQDLRKDGSLLPVETVSQPIRYADRQARLVVALDKTAQQKAEKEVQDHLLTMQRAADAAQAITWHQTLEGTMQEIAEQARGVIGAQQSTVSLARGSADGQGMRAVSLAEKYETSRELIEQADGSGLYAQVQGHNRAVRLTQAELDAHLRRCGGQAFSELQPPMRGLLAVPLVDRNGKNMGVLQLSDKYEGEFTKQDEYVALELGHLASAALENARLLEEVSRLNTGLEQKVAERTAALARQEAMFRTLAEQAPQMVWTANPDGAATYCNRAWLELIGGQASDWVGHQWLAVVHPDDVAETKANWKQARASKAAYAGIRRLLGQDGRYHTMAYRGAPVLDSQGEVSFWVGIDADITEIKATEAALRLSNQELEAFSYSVSHDLRSPLNTIDGFSRLLAKQLAPHLSGETSQKTQHYLARIQAGVAQMGQLIEALLSLSQVARAQLNIGLVDLALMAGDFLEEWQARHPQRRVTVHIEPGLRAQADERLMRVALQNLLANACKFTAYTECAEISVGQKFDAAGLPVFFVRDNGAGFDMAYAARLFDPFQRLHTATEFPGTGVGLATVSRVIKRHGGTIWAESSPNAGAIFFFTLPS
ncbi:MAG: PAS domain S-box protein [Polaromonas sp.]